MDHRRSVLLRVRVLHIHRHPNYLSRGGTGGKLCLQLLYRRSPFTVEGLVLLVKG